jgi:hypothetical protein
VLTRHASAATPPVKNNCCPAEAEFALWLEAVAAGGTYEHMYRVLRMLGYELNHLKPRTLALVQRFFE